MPEGPETWNMANNIRKSLKDREIISFKLLYKTLLPLNDFSTLTVLNVLPRGKAIVIDFSNGLSIVTHNQLYGKWTINRPSTKIKTGRKLRLEFTTKKKIVRLWSATDILILKTNCVFKHPYIQKIGPDVLDKETDTTMILNQLKNKRFRNRKLSSILLDQSFIAGLGNYLRSEILFFSKLMHTLKPSVLDDKALKKLSREIKDVSVRAYHQKGKTLNYHYIAKEFGNIHNFKKLKHMVFAREGLPCLKCGYKISKSIISSRRIFLCKICQKSNFK